ncbi:MAG: hypothetical protein K2Y02_05605 [Burkholderiaceae bacterium]|nr:hypothetical protein [Burkholderiaceae bacterium]
MTWSAIRTRRRLDICVWAHSSDDEMLDCLIQALQRPDFDIVDRALIDVRQMASYEIRAAQRMEIVVHLTGLLTSRPELRVAIVYADLGLGDLGRFLVEFRQMAGDSIGRFVDRAQAVEWLE